MTAMIVWQANASSNEFRNESEKDSKIEHMNRWMRLGSGMKMRSGDKIWSGKKVHIDDDKKYYGSGKKEHMGSGNKLGTGVNKNMNKKTKKLDSVFKKMTDEKLTSLLTQINTLTTTITDPTLLSIINNIKTLIQQNIGN